MTKASSLLQFVVPGAVCLLIGYLAWSKLVPEPLPFGDVTPQAIAGLLGSLFVIALFVERAVEVVVMVFRDQQSDVLDEEEVRALKAVEDAGKVAGALAGNAAAGQTEKDAASKAVEGARLQLDGVRDQKVIYRDKTKRIALSLGLVLGVLVSLGGVRALHGLLAASASPGRLFTAVDIIVTSAMIAGGSEGIHRIVKVVTSSMDFLSARADQNQKALGKPGSS